MDVSIVLFSPSRLNYTTALTNLQFLHLGIIKIEPLTGVFLNPSLMYRIQPVQATSTFLFQS